MGVGRYRVGTREGEGRSREQERGRQGEMMKWEKPGSKRR